jgi:pimeloyl-ACP methyl ester carboxylesterase
VTPSQHVLELDGCTLHYRRAGSGPPLLFLHGFDGAVWSPFFDALARDYDVILPDHPGYGGSSMPAWLRSVHDLAYFYLDAMRELGLAGVHVMGHSIGGWIASELAIRQTASLATLTLIAPAGLRVKGVERADIFLLAPEKLIRTLYTDQQLAETLIAAAANDEQADVDAKNRFTTARLAWHPRMFDPQLAVWLHRIDVPTLIVWGADDRIIPPACAEPFRALVPGARVATIARAGHVPHRERPDDVLAQVVPFLAAAAAPVAQGVLR